ncbi:MAG: hypothetical protein CMJ83_13280 [Planctomycetes bacterium]|nr:hypothetical protein [Planctomycetota bacterium]
MSLDELLRDAHVVLTLRAPDKWSALAELSRCAAATGLCGPDQADPVYDAIAARERSLSTGMEQGLAVPHAFLPQMASTRLLLALAPDGVPWDALDGEDARVIALLLAPATAEARSRHLRLLALLARFYMAPEHRNALLGAVDEAAVRSAIGAFLDGRV